jgi:hypothetical protein
MDMSMKKRLKNSADVACQMFCGLRLTTSKNRLVELGSGTLEMHLLTGECFFESASVDSLPICGEIQAWFRKELAAQKIRPEAIARATIKATIQLSLVPWTKRENRAQVFYENNQEVRTIEVHRCVIECVSVIATEKTSYTSCLSDVEEWPAGWPKSGWSFSKPV